MAATSAESMMKDPAEAAREPVGYTYVTTGTGERRMAWMMSRMEVSRPPGVLMVMRIRLACSVLACAISRTRYSESIGSISPSMRSSTTVEFVGDAVDAGGVICA